MKQILNILLMVSCLNVQATNYFVTTEAALATAITSAVAGDVITMENGVWTNVHILFSGTGTASQNIFLEAETRGQVFLEGNSKLSVGGSYLVVDGLYFRNGFITNSDKAVIEFRSSSSNLADHCRITNCTIIDFNPPSSATEYKYVSIYGDHNRFDHCHIEGKNNDGASLVVWTAGLENHHLIDYNYFGPRPILGQNGGETIRCGDSSNSLLNSFNTFEHNLFDQCNGEIEIISNKTGGSVFRYNTFRDCIGLLTLRHGNGSEVYNNYFFGNYSTTGQGGIRVIGEGHKIYNNYFQDLNNGSSDLRGAIVLMNCEQNPALNGYAPVVNVLVANNTIVNCKTALILGGGDNATRTVQPDQCTVTNNIMYSTRGDNVLIDYQDTPTQIIYTANIAFGDPLGISSQTGILEIDPLLQVPSSDELWRPELLSPAIDAADLNFINGIFTNDIDGQSRTGSYDIGADELSANPITYPPLMMADVGPIAPGEILPIILMSFQVNLEGRFNKLEWETSMEVNFDYFEVQKKDSQQRSFQKIGLLNGVGYSSRTEKYFFIDEQPFIHSFYRLKMVDKDGSFKFSPLISLKRKEGEKPSLSVFPLPARASGFEVTIYWGEQNNGSTPCFLSIHDVNGQEILRKQFYSTASTDVIYFNDRTINAGLYIIKLSKGNTLLTSRKIIFIDD